MFGVKAWHARNSRGLRKFVEWSVAFAQSDDLLLRLWRGKTSRNRHTPLRSMDSFKVRRSRHRVFKAVGFREFHDESVISSRLPHCEQRKSCAAELATEPQPMQRKRNVAWLGAEPFSEVVEGGMDWKLISEFADIGRSC
jgi:hypothetical protein